MIEPGAGPVRCVALGAGVLAVAAGQAGAVMLWSTATGKPLATAGDHWQSHWLEGHTGAVTSLTIGGSGGAGVGASGAVLISTGVDGTTRVWGPLSSRPGGPGAPPPGCLAVLEPAEGPVVGAATCGALLPGGDGGGGNLLLAAGFDDGSARLWPVDAGPAAPTSSAGRERPATLPWGLPGTPFEDGRGRVVTRDPYDPKAGLLHHPGGHCSDGGGKQQPAAGAKYAENTRTAMHTKGTVIGSPAWLREQLVDAPGGAALFEGVAAGLEAAQKTLADRISVNEVVGFKTAPPAVVRCGHSPTSDIRTLCLLLLSKRSFPVCALNQHAAR
eukprot:SAG22_NODE_401_length_11080_cov_18.258082_4_plen_329_part_00